MILFNPPIFLNSFSNQFLQLYKKFSNKIFQIPRYQSVRITTTNYFRHSQSSWLSTCSACQPQRSVRHRCSRSSSTIECKAWARVFNAAYSVSAPYSAHSQPVRSFTNLSSSSRSPYPSSFSFSLFSSPIFDFFDLRNQLNSNNSHNNKLLIDFFLFFSLSNIKLKDL